MGVLDEYKKFLEVESKDARPRGVILVTTDGSYLWMPGKPPTGPFLSTEAALATVEDARGITITTADNAMAVLDAYRRGVFDEVSKESGS